MDLSYYVENYVRKTESCWLWVGLKNRGGYGVGMRKGKHFLAHRLFYALTTEKIPHGMCVLHKCDVRNCVNPDHLFIGTYADNNKDRSKKGRNGYVKGGKHPRAILSDEKVIEMRKLRNIDGLKFREIAELFGVHLTTAVYAVKGKNWPHIKESV